MSIASQRAEIVRDVRRILEERRNKGRQRARELGIATRTVRRDGTVLEVVDLDETSNQPVFMTTHNASAGISTGADRMRGIYGLSGAGVVVGVWDGGVGRASHQEFDSGRLVARDGGVLNDHATHVAGTIAARGAVPSAIGMAVGGSVDSYDWNSDTSEMISRAATYSLENGKIQLSNHSYGYVRGWYWNGARYVWNGFSGNTAADFETYFGTYGSRTRSIDAIAHDAPYYLMFWSAGNERNNNPSSGSSVSIGGAIVAYNPSLHPAGDGVYRGGYDTVADSAVAKNVMTIGAANDAVTSGVRDPSKASITSFSSWGPTDDGRIKPDLVANGATVYSALSGGNAAYGTYSGTSMSAPNATGTAALLVDHYGRLFPGQAMRASTLKGLLLHTADDRGNPGPDYQYGWGLLNGEEAAALISDQASSPGKLRLAESVLTAHTGSRVHEFAWSGAGPVKVTVCWTDPEAPSQWAADVRTSTLVNNLDIKLVGPDGSEFFPFVMPFVGTWTQASMGAHATTGVNVTDNVEQILVHAPTPGVYQIFVTHTGVLAGGEQHYSLLVSGSAIPNEAPFISGIDDIVMDEDGGPVTLEFSVSDDQTEAAGLVLDIQSDNPGLTGEVSLHGEGGGRTLSFTPQPDASGVAQVIVTASDGELSSQEHFLVTVNAVNDPPVVTAPGNIQMDPGAFSGELTFLVTDVDDDGAAIFVQATSDNQELLPNSGITLSDDESGRKISLLLSPDRYGTSTVTIVAHDGKATGLGSFSATVNNPHPRFSSWIEGWGLAVGTGSADDPDGDGRPNALEYFHGSDPTADNSEPVTIQHVLGDFVMLDYRRSKEVNGVRGAVKWSTELGEGSQWTAEGVVDFPISADPNYDWRRAIVPWPEGGTRVFTRIDLIFED